MSLSQFGDGYATDDYNVYYRGQRIGGNPKCFVSLDNGYAKDNHHT